MKKRIAWFDLTRGTAFLMVIFNHLDYGNDVVMRFFTPVFLTTFFFVSGYLFRVRVPFRQMFIARTRRLMQPFVLLGTITILLSSVLSFNEKQIGILESFKELFMQYGYAHINVMWFIPSLYLYSFGFYFLCQIENTYKQFAAFVACGVLNWFLVYIVQIPHLPWHVEWMGFAWFYMYMGKVYKKNQNLIDKYLNLFSCTVLLAIYVGYIVLTGNSCNFQASPLLFDAVMLTLIGLALMVYSCKALNNRFIRFVGANSLLYFAFHGKAMSIVNVFFNHIDITSTTLLGTEAIIVLKTICTAVLLIPVCILVNRYAPFLVGGKFGVKK